MEQCKLLICEPQEKVELNDGRVNHNGCKQMDNGEKPLKIHGHFRPPTELYIRTFTPQFIGLRRKGKKYKYIFIFMEYFGDTKILNRIPKHNAGSKAGSNLEYLYSFTLLII
ncbi:hypothetical protein BLOT_013207 [Blomia tropicalis]|nr:hypothetical protein BLOT_013207 [Blomia tropicalis]